MKQLAYCAFAAALCISMGLQASGAAQARFHTVRQLRMGDRELRSASDVTIARGGTVAHAIRVHERIDDGTRIDVTGNLTVVVVSSDNKSTITLEPGSSVTFVSTGKGELIAANGGTSQYFVEPHSLDFFRVQSSEVLTASVRGTQFSVAASGGSVTYICRSGEVNIVKAGYLIIGTKRLKTSLIDVLSSTRSPQLTYHPSLTWELAHYDTFPQAEAFYRSQLSRATASGDRAAIDAARLNLANILRFEGNYAEAQDLFGAVFVEEQQLGDADREANALKGNGLILFDQSNYVDALKAFDRALQLFAQVNDEDGKAGDVHGHR